MSEKRVNEIKVRCGDPLFNALAKLAHQQDKALAEYVHNLLYHHAFGAVCSVFDTEEECDVKRRAG